MTKGFLIFPGLFSLVSFHLVAGPFTFTTIDFPSSTGTDAFGINDSGQMVGEYLSGGTDHGFLLSGGIFSTIDGPGSPTITSATGINDSGQVVGFYSPMGGDRGFLLS